MARVYYGKNIGFDAPDNNNLICRKQGLPDRRMWARKTVSHGISMIWNWPLSVFIY